MENLVMKAFYPLLLVIESKLIYYLKILTKIDNFMQINQLLHINDYI